MSYLNLYIDKIILSSINNTPKITNFTLLFNNISTAISSDNILIKLFNISTITFNDYLANSTKAYYTSNVTSTSCVINFYPSYELCPSDIIIIELNNLLDSEGNLLNDKITVSLSQLFFENTSTSIFYQLPEITGDYKILLTEVNEKDVSPKNISSQIIKIANPISSGILANNNMIDRQTSDSFEFRTELISDIDNELITADFTTVLQIKIN